MSAPRKSNLWQLALRKYNEGKAYWVIPKAGTKEHAEVKKIQKRLEKKAKSTPVVEEKVKTKTKTKKEKSKAKAKTPPSSGEDEAAAVVSDISDDE